MVIASIMAGHMTLLTSRASKAGDNLEQEILNAIKKSQKNEEINSKTTWWLLEINVQIYYEVLMTCK